MINSISWSHFIFAAIGLVSLYYLVLLGLFIKAKINRGASPDPAGNPQRKRRFWQLQQPSTGDDATGWKDDDPSGETDPGERTETEGAAEEQAFDQLTQLAGELEALLSKDNETMTRSAILHATGQLLRKYPDLYRLPFRVAIYNLIRKRAQQECNWTITEEELEIAWKG